MNAVIEVPSRSREVAIHAATATEIKAHVQLIQQVMSAVMKDKTHYGIIPGTPKPSLWKPGAEVLCATFRIAPSYRVEDLSDHDRIRYRVTCVGTHQMTGVVLGEGMGECSSSEEKYKWKKAFNREFEAADESRRRLKFGYDREKREEYEIRQVRTEPDDLANTVLKMACKRAQVAMTLNVTAASDIFTQDLEDMPEGVREAVASEESESPAPAKNQTAQPKSTGNGRGVATEKQVKLVGSRLDNSGIPENDFLAAFEIDSLSALPFAKVDEALKWIGSRAA